MSLVQRVQSFLADRLGHAPEQPEPDHSVQLYWCSECCVTFITDAMDACPRCNAAVEQVPDERALGHLPEDTA